MMFVVQGQHYDVVNQRLLFCVYKSVRERSLVVAYGSSSSFVMDWYC